MHKHWQDWGLGDLEDALGLKGFGFWAKGGRSAGGRRRQQIFEAGELRLVILRLLKERPRHGYDIIKALEERMAGCYTPSAGTIYPTLQMLEDQGLVRVVENEGKKVYHITTNQLAIVVVQAVLKWFTISLLVIGLKLMIFVRLAALIGLWGHHLIEWLKV